VYERNVKRSRLFHPAQYFEIQFVFAAFCIRYLFFPYVAGVRRCLSLYFRSSAYRHEPRGHSHSLQGFKQYPGPSLGPGPKQRLSWSTGHPHFRHLGMYVVVVVSEIDTTSFNSSSLVTIGILITNMLFLPKHF